MVTPVVCLETRQPVISSSMSSTLFCFDNLTEDHRHHRFDCHLRPHRAFPSSKPEVAQWLSPSRGGGLDAAADPAAGGQFTVMLSCRAW